jgi:hypothetical protein
MKTNKYIVTVFDNTNCQLTTVKVKAYNLAELETLIKVNLGTDVIITAIIVTQ